MRRDPSPVSRSAPHATGRPHAQRVTGSPRRWEEGPMFCVELQLCMLVRKGHFSSFQTLPEGVEATAHRRRRGTRPPEPPAAESLGHPTLGCTVPP